jgi:hypothetical protein
MRRLHSIVTLLLLTPTTGRAQTEWSFGIVSTMSRWRIENAGQEIILGSVADRSPVPSLVTYDGSTLDKSTSYAIGISAERGRTSAFVETNYLQYGTGFVNGAVGGIGYQLRRDEERAWSPLLAGHATVGFAWGEIGEVGARPGDVYLIAPDGEQYPAGSKIGVRAATLGLDVSGGMLMRFSERVTVQVSGGYRAMTPVKEWTYHVRSASGDQESALPPEGFAANPPVLKMDGAFLRLVLVFSPTT